jgi:hypothetical protein
MSNAEVAGGRESGVSLGYVFYTQVAGVLGAFSLAAFAGHHFSLGWRGLLLTMISAWDAYIRPATNWLLDATVVALAKSFIHIQIDIPPMLRDYLSVGLILCLSWVRASRWAHAHFVQTLRVIVGNPERADVDEMIEAEEEVLVDDDAKVGHIRFVLRLITNVLFWPLALASFLLTPFMAKWNSRLDRIAIIQTALTISPLFYFGLLYAANVLLVKS